MTRVYGSKSTMHRQLTKAAQSSLPPPLAAPVCRQPLPCLALDSVHPPASHWQPASPQRHLTPLSSVPTLLQGGRRVRLQCPGHPPTPVRRLQGQPLRHATHRWQRRAMPTLQRRAQPCAHLPRRLRQPRRCRRRCSTSRCPPGCYRRTCAPAQHRQLFRMHATPGLSCFA